MLNGVMAGVPAVVAEIPLQEEYLILVKNCAYPGRSPKHAADFNGLKVPFDQPVAALRQGAAPLECSVLS